ncbi:MAG: hypothetical protein UX85_C0007G0070 [Candidatus Beckwithbacteria bacterium GW2011_GWB1_47_15]|uniref:Uncharacterized protein n=1 Tax=Candidatus Beckwithbacteria bacterium GW2011_GWB1_47_15 TaxID=1618371 RepID=A0A0G1U368_9BACT|nr:MAG: hypothetical protein UX50_C0006G0065 [Candidatus Beckwithbacteria bacterium GW2011_GWA1_46_30]KKU60783.1 MAG: hypothetical protein UX85_C0007G0070 [Candidatus Beckwithbacteria bacterium GW2011_GWB1_47_15]KKU71588.1 MAG: hypothetical protein UX97_C0005G0071 [Candidatus Beckwithbacteria bacterium GW2011_GWA2_47_25]KKW03459.1 MAG: hypothetical protein UY37_C0005G0022 [Candidatus Beckwithbacteria bacterium GW2011_GWC2_49_11]
MEFGPIGAIEQARVAENELGRKVQKLLADSEISVGGLFFGVSRVEPLTTGKLILAPSTPTYAVEGLNQFREYLLESVFPENYEEDVHDEDRQAYITAGDGALILPRIFHYEQIGIEEHITVSMAKINDDFDLELMRAAGKDDTGRRFFDKNRYDEKAIIRFTSVIIFPDSKVAHLASRLHHLSASGVDLSSELGFKRLNFYFNDGKIMPDKLHLMENGVYPYEDLFSRLDGFSTLRE